MPSDDFAVLYTYAFDEIKQLYHKDQEANHGRQPIKTGALVALSLSSPTSDIHCLQVSFPSFSMPSHVFELQRKTHQPGKFKLDLTIENAKITDFTLTGLGDFGGDDVKVKQMAAPAKALQFLSGAVVGAKLYEQLYVHDQQDYQVRACLSAL